MKFTYFLYTLLFSAFLISCTDTCAKFERESYPKNDLKIEFEAKDGLNILYGYLDELDYSTSTFESYRLLHGAADTRTKRLIRLDHTDDGAILSYKIFSAQATPEGGMEVNVIEQHSYALSSKDWDTFQNLVYKKAFWTMPEMIGKTGYKGVTYFIEGTRPQAKVCAKRTQQMVTRWNPTSGKFYALCTHIEALLTSYKGE